MSRAVEILDLLASGSLEEAERGIDGLGESFPAYAPAAVVEEVLRRRLERTAPPQAPPTSEPTTTEGSAASAPAEARSLLEAGREAEALERLEEAWALDPGNSQVSGALADLLKKIGLEQYSRGDSTRAVASWKKALAARPGDAETMRFLERASAVNRKL